ncbi:MAG TPA: hypothetical protein VHH36_08280 [Candidatus Thermoplasmatota archaeon]|nr:hypothetical protein [Candidatus Thermoplasmatota archaeon]
MKTKMLTVALALVATPMLLPQASASHTCASANVAGLVPVVVGTVYFDSTNTFDKEWWSFPSSPLPRTFTVGVRPEVDNLGGTHVDTGTDLYVEVRNSTCGFVLCSGFASLLLPLRCTFSGPAVVGVDYSWGGWLGSDHIHFYVSSGA